MILSLPFAILEWKPLGIKELILVLLMSILTQIAQVSMTKAYQLEALAGISILNYLGILYAIILGFVFYNEKLSGMQLLGIACILIGVISNVFIKK